MIQKMFKLTYLYIRENRVKILKHVSIIEYDKYIFLLLKNIKNLNTIIMHTLFIVEKHIVLSQFDFTVYMNKLLWFHKKVSNY